MHGDRHPDEARDWPRVTAVMQAVGIIDYSMIPASKRDFYLQRGSDVHMIVESIEKGEPDYWTGDDLEGYADAYQNFKRDTGFRAHFSEMSVWNPTRSYKGRMDLAGEFDDGREVAIDVKSGAVAAWTAVQLAAYVACLPDPHKWDRFGLQLKPNGKYKIPPAFPNYHADSNFFFSCVNVIHGRELYGKFELI